MKNVKIITISIFLLLFGLTKAQKIGIINTKYILNQIPQYKEAEARLNLQIDTWQSELQRIQSDYDKKKSAFENERVLLVGEQLKSREKEIMDLEKNIKTTTSLRFGNSGEIAKLKANLLIPYENQIQNAITAVSEKNGLGTVLDKQDYNVLYLQKKFDYTEKVLDIILNRAPAPEKKETSGTKGKK